MPERAADPKGGILSNTGDAAGDSFVSFENLTGSAYADKLNGDSGNNVLTGGGSNDELYGHAGHDTIKGGKGSDVFFFSGGEDSYEGGEGDDLYYTAEEADGFDGADKLTLTFSGTFGHDRISGNGRGFRIDYRPANSMGFGVEMISAIRTKGKQIGRMTKHLAS